VSKSLLLASALATLLATAIGFAAPQGAAAPPPQAPQNPAPQGGRGGRGAPQGPPPTAQAQAPFDMTGYWVSVVTEDWRWRMMTPPKGDYSSVPLNNDGRRVADSWDLAKDKVEGNECRAFGAAAVTRQPGRLHVTWQDDSTLKIETSAGNQTRLLRFTQPQEGTASAAAGERTWQGSSVAQWRKQQPVPAFGFGGRGGGSVAGGNLKIV